MKLLRWAALLAAITAFEALLAAQTPQDAQALEARGEWPAAEAVWRTLTHEHPQDFRFWTSLGIALAHQNKFAEAIDAYRKALALNPNASQAEFNLGLAYFKSGKLANAIEPLEHAAAEMPGAPQVQLVLGMCLYGTGKYGKSATHLEKAQARDPENKELRFVLAQAYLWSGEYAQAQREFQTMLERDPDSAQVHMLLGEAYDGLGKPDEALAEFQTAVAKGPIPDAHFGVGYLYWKAHKYQEAAAEFKDELKIDFKNNRALAYLGDSELNLGEVTTARRDLLGAVAEGGNLWVSHFDLGKIAEDEKNYPAAFAEFKRAVALDADRPEAHYHLAHIYKLRGEEAQARAEFATVARLHQRRSDDLIVKISGNH